MKSRRRPKPIEGKAELVEGKAKFVEADDFIAPTEDGDPHGWVGPHAKKIADQSREIEKLKPEARRGEQFRTGPQYRKVVQDKKDFLADARKVLAGQPTLNREALVNHLRLAKYRDAYKDTRYENAPYRWTGVLIKGRGGRPKKN